jgi:hypothetical protein
VVVVVNVVVVVVFGGHSQNSLRGAVVAFVESLNASVELFQDAVVESLNASVEFLDRLGSFDALVAFSIGNGVTMHSPFTHTAVEFSGASHVILAHAQSQ